MRISPFPSNSIWGSYSIQAWLESLRIALNYLLSRPSATVYTLASSVATNGSADPIALDECQWEYEANKTYAFRFIGNVSPSAAHSGCGFQLLTSTSIDEICMGFHHQSGTGTVQTGGSSIASNASLSSSSDFPGTDAYPIIGSGFLKTDTSPGTATLMIRSEDGGVVTAIGGFVLIVEQVS